MKLRFDMPEAEFKNELSSIDKEIDDYVKKYQEEVNSFLINKKLSVATSSHR